MSKLPGWLRVLLTPSCWVQNNRYLEMWDLELRDLLDQHKFTHISRYTAAIGGVTLWIENQPYACMNPEGLSIRASRATILRALDQFYKDMWEERKNATD